ncbi:MAG TPA: hypothetical protein VFT42_03110 [Solirubrobacteraceae bacterium]|nr:hypothetical protein [Solirubrobacteraceae bacterium]
MIVRISNEGQYRVDDSRLERLNELDDAVVRAVEEGDESAFGATFGELLRYVRDEGTQVGDDELETSDFILPPADLSFAEAGEEFTGDGLIPDPA